MICQACCRVYMGQTGRNFKGHFPEHVTYIKPSISQSVYVTYLLYVSHSYRPPASTTKLTEHSKYRWKMNADENLHTDLHEKDSPVISEPAGGNITPLLKLPTNYKHLTQAHKHVPCTILLRQSVSNHAQKPHPHTYVTELNSKHSYKPYTYVKQSQFLNKQITTTHRVYYK